MPIATGKSHSTRTENQPSDLALWGGILDLDRSGFGRVGGMEA